VLKLGAHGDDSLGSGHLQLEVGVVGDRHELRICQPPEDRVVRYVPGKPTTSKVSISLRKFPSSSKVTGRSICPSGTASIPGMTLWNGIKDGRS
jgi:hypothetical protein